MKIITKFAKLKFLNFANGKQFGEFIGLRQNIVCAGGIRHQDSDSETNFESESEFDFDEATSETNFESESEFELDAATSEADSTWKLYDDYFLILPGSKIPKWWFNHQSVGSSVSFSVGRKLPSFAFCVALKVERKDDVPHELLTFNCFAYMYINGLERYLQGYDSRSDPLSFMWVYYRRDWPVEDKILGDRNDIEIRFECSNYDPKIVKITIERCGVNVSCICPSCNFAANEDADFNPCPPLKKMRNHRPTYARRPQKHYLSHFGWLRIRFRLWKRSSRPTLPSATLMSRYFLLFYYSLSQFGKPKNRKQTSFFFFWGNSRALREMEEIDPRAFNNGAEDSGIPISHTNVNDGSNSKLYPSSMKAR